LLFWLVASGTVLFLKESLVDRRTLKRIVRTRCPGLDGRVVALVAAGSLLRAKIAESLSSGGVPDALTAAIEMAHTASLLHDDVLDQESWRRGGESFNRLLGNRACILNGDILLSGATVIMGRQGDMALLEAFMAAVQETCQGEIAQQRFLLKRPPSLCDYFENARAKTGSFFGFAAFCGATFSPLQGERKGLEDVFSRIGALYQLLDDLEDSTTQNKSRTDVANGLVTFPAVLYGKGKGGLPSSEEERMQLYRERGIMKKGRGYIFRRYAVLSARLEKMLSDRTLLEAIDGIFR